MIATVLAATVLREPIAYAAERLPSFIVANTVERPVPVATTDKTEVVARAEVNRSNPINVDVSRYRELRLAASGYGCSDDGGSYLIVFAIEDCRHYRVRQIELCRVGVGIVPTFAEELMASVLEVPGRTIRIDVTTVGSVELVVFGRTN